MQSVREIFLMRALRSVLELLLGNCDGRDFASVIFRRVHAKTTPPAADFQNVIAVFQFQLAAKLIVFRRLRRLQILIFRLKISGRIRHAGVEKKFKEIVAEIVMV